MTRERDLERILDSWLNEGPIQAGDHVIDAVAVRIVRQPQRPAWRLRPWRFPTMSIQLRVAAIVGALLIATVAGGVLILGGGSPPPSPTAPTQRSSPSPAATTAASIAASPGSSSAASGCGVDPTSCAGPLAAGTHESATFGIPIRFAVPAGWQNTIDIARSYGLTPTSRAADAPAAIQVLGMIAIADQTTSRCDPVAKAGVGTSVDEITAYVQGHPGLVSSAPTAATVDGHPGRQIEFTVSTSWGQSCPGFNPGDPRVMMLTDTGTPPGRAIGYGSDVRVRWTIFEVNGQTVIIELVGPADPAAFAQAAVGADAVVASIRFLPGG